jgi:hypothetical protein
MAGPVVIQRGVSTIPNGTSPWTPTITLSSAPVQNNLLIAVVWGVTATPSAGTGWTLDTSFSAGSYYVASFYKYAGVAESTTQTPSSTSQALASLVMWEVAGVSTVWTNAHVASGGSASSTANTTDSFSLTTSIGDTLVLGGWVGASSGGVAGSSFTLSSLSITAAASNQGGTTPVYVMALAGEEVALNSGTVITDNWTSTQAVFQSKIYIQITSDTIPANTQGVSKITAYTEVGPPASTQNAAQVTGYTVHGAPSGSQQVAQITGYIMVKPATPTPGWISVME